MSRAVDIFPDACLLCVYFLTSLQFPEAQRASLLAWKREAVKREKIHTVRRREQLRQLKHHVASRLQQLSKVNTKIIVNTVKLVCSHIYVPALPLNFVYLLPGYFSFTN